MNPVANQKRGAAFERVVQKSFDAQPCFTVSHVSPPSRIIGKRVVFTANPFLDFVGVMRVPGVTKGVPLFCECKTTKETKLRCGSGGLSEAQIAALFRWWKAGAIACVLWCCIGRGVRVFGYSELYDWIFERSHTLHFDGIGSLVPVIGDKLDMVAAVRLVEERNRTKGTA